MTYLRVTAVLAVLFWVSLLGPVYRTIGVWAWHALCPPPPSTTTALTSASTSPVTAQGPLTISHGGTGHTPRPGERWCFPAHRPPPGSPWAREQATTPCPPPYVTILDVREDWVRYAYPSGLTDPRAQRLPDFLRSFVYIDTPASAPLTTFDGGLGVKMGDGLEGNVDRAITLPSSP